MAAVTFREFALQDDNLIVAQQEMLESGVVERFPLGDQEILCRHLHAVVADWVADYRREPRARVARAPRQGDQGEMRSISRPQPWRSAA